MAWARQPILVVSCALGVIGEANNGRQTQIGWCALFRTIHLQAHFLCYLDQARRKVRRRDGTGQLTTKEVSYITIISIHPYTTIQILIHRITSRKPAVNIIIMYIHVIAFSELIVFGMCVVQSSSNVCLLLS